MTRWDGVADGGAFHVLARDAPEPRSQSHPS